MQNLYVPNNRMSKYKRKTELKRDTDRFTIITVYFAVFFFFLVIGRPSRQKTTKDKIDLKSTINQLTFKESSISQ